MHTMKNPVIYTPRGAAREYAEWACNVYRGCTHGCSYCFGPSVGHATREEFLKAQTRGPDFLQRVEADAKRLSQDGKIGFQVHLCFTTDPYQEFESALHITRDTVKILHKYGLSVAILTKGGRRLLPDIGLYGPMDAIAATMTYATKEDTLREEPCTAMPQERWEVLKIAHEHGVPTWISCEPVLDPAQTLYLINMMSKDVDHVKIGKLNHDSAREAKINWKQFGQHALILMDRLGYKRIFNPDDAVRANAANRTYYVKSGLAKILEGA